MIGVILAAGRGTRLGQGNKNLLPTKFERNGKVVQFPMICQSVFKLLDTNLDKIFIVVNPERASDFEKALGAFNITSLIHQNEPLGAAHALACCREVARKEKFIVVLGDNFFDEDLAQFIKFSEAHPNDAIIAVTESDTPEKFGNVEIVDGKVTKMIEKPEVPLSNIIIAGILSYPPDYFEHYDRIKPSVRGEYELIDVNKIYLEQGRIRTYQLKGKWADLGTPDVYKRHS